MFGIRLFKLPKARQYNYKPVFYDEKKDKQEYKQGSELQNETYESRIRDSFKRRTNTVDKKEIWNKNVRLLIIITLLTALALYLLYF